MMPIQIRAWLLLQFIGVVILLCTVNILHGQTKPNIIIILSDDAGYADFGCYGGKDVQTPHIDELAKNGVMYTAAYATASVCAPSRAGLLTGKYQQRFGFEHNTSNLPTKGFSIEDIGLDTSVRTIGDHLQANGYKTIAIGKWHQGDQERHFPMNRGFDHFYGFIGGHRSYFSIEEAAIHNDLKIYDDHRIVPESDISYLSYNLTDKAMQYMEEYQHEPFFLYLAYNAVHTPMDATSEGLKHYQHVTDTLRRTYLAMLYDLDLNVGRLVDKLKEKGLYDNTLIFFLNDNGAATNNAANNGSLRGLKGSKWEGGIRVPLIVQWPNQLPKGKLSNSLASTMDVLATSLHAAKAKPLSGQILDGKNLMKSNHPAKGGHSYLFWRRGIAKAVRHKDWKLIVVGDNPVLLFDLKKDLAEEHNIALEYPKVVKQLKRKLAKWEKTMHDPKWISPYGDYNQLMKHRIEVVGRSNERMYP